MPLKRYKRLLTTLKKNGDFDWINEDFSIWKTEEDIFEYCGVKSKRELFINEGLRIIEITIREKKCKSNKQ